jgi:type II secretory pathway component GspD/PulD (secretin)
MRLVRIFDEYADITIVGKSNHSRYDALYEVVRIPDARVDLDRIQKYVQSLQQRYPDKNFMLKKVKIEGKEYYVISRKSYIITPDGKRKKVRDRIPIYIDLEEQAFYIPKSYIEKNRKLANYVIMRVLGALGVSRVRYAGILGR